MATLTPVDTAMGGRRSTAISTVAIAALLWLVTAPSATAQVGGGQTAVATNQMVISGYGTVRYAYRTQGSAENEFAASVNPIFLFQILDRVLFEAEFEFESQDGITETNLEYAQLDLMVHDHLTLVGGEFLVPFGIFGERLHPSWINKFVTPPPIYGHHGTAFGVKPLLPILSDVGFMARAALRPGPLHLGLNAYVTQGPSTEAGSTDTIPELEFLSSSSDNNLDKMVGGRLDIALPPWFEVSFSYLTGDYDANNVLAIEALNVALELRAANLELRGEYLQARQEIEQPTGFPKLVRHGFYAQAAFRVGRWQPVFRWTQVFDNKLDGVVQERGARQAGVGLDYWIGPSVAVKAGLELNREDGVEFQNDRAVMQIGFGF